MRGGIPEHKIEEIREATDIVELISGYVTLKKKSGQNHFGLCPFHNEKTPSFTVHEGKQIFHCFGCGAGGNAFTFLMRYEGTSFPDVVKFLAQRAGIELEFEEREVDEAHVKQNEALFHINEFAAKSFQDALLSADGAEALAYLKNRGVSEEHVRKYGLGYALPEWDSLIKRAEKTANSLDHLLKAGLALKSEQGRQYDRFRDRVMFPILNLSGRVVAFGGRILKSRDDSPKYVNSPESPVYEKGKILYGLYQNRDNIRQQRKAVFVEGYMDLLSLDAHGINNVVATSGTALTDDQARLIRRYTRNVVMMYDSDLAGSAATMRGADVLVEHGLEVFVSNLPEGHDPDSFVREFGADATLARIEQAQPLFDYKLQHVLAVPADKRTEAVRSLLETLSKIKDRIHRNVLVSRAAQELHLSEKILWAELDSIGYKRVQQIRRRSEMGERLQGLSDVKNLNRSEKAIAELIRILLHDWSQAEFVFNNLDMRLLAASPKQPIVTFLKNKYKSDGQPTEDELLHQFNDIELTQFIVAEYSREWDDNIDAARWAADCVLSLQMGGLQQEIETVREELKTKGQDPEERRNLLQRCVVLEQEKTDLINRLTPPKTGPGQQEAPA